MPTLFARDGLGADYEKLVIVQDAASGLRAIIAIHSTALGPAAGGIRRLAYPSEDEAMADVLRLAGMMTVKCALAGLPAGGAKTVILDHAGLDRAGAYRALARAVDDLAGTYLAGPDVGTGDADIETMRQVTRHVNPAGNDAATATAAGVLAGIRGTLRHLDGDGTFSGRRFAVQGLGAVGRAVADGLMAGGGTVVGCDLNAAATAAANEAGVLVVPATAILAEPCDIFVPCALGGIITEAVARDAPWRAVCGSANNQLATPAAGGVLAERGIPYAPDFVVNAGAVIEGVLTTRDGASDAVRAAARQHIGRIEETVVRILGRARDEGAPPEEVAMGMALAQARGGAAEGR